MLACAVFPLLFCHCGGGGNEGEGDAGEVDTIELVKAALFPTVSPEDNELPAEVLAAAKGKTWGEILTTCSEKPPAWSTERLTELDGYSGVRADLVIMKEAGWVKFKVSDEGGVVTAFQVGEGDDVDTDDEEEIAMGFAGLFAMKSGDVDTNGIVENAKAQAIVNKNLATLKGTFMVARVYSLDRDGAYPMDLKELSSIEEAGPFRRPTDPSTGEKVDPIYFGGLDTDSAGHLMLLACPFTNPDGTRTVAFMDGSAQNIPEKDYQEKLAKQKQ